MLFKKKNKKIDPKIRFQHKQFTGKLVTARNYKRNALAIPETGFDKALSKIGLGSKWAQIGFGIVLLGFIYLIYFPNFLTVKQINITGLSESQARDLEISIRDEIADANFFYPEKNLLFLRTKVVSQAVSKIPSVNKVSVVSKSFSDQTLNIEAESKYEKYLVTTPSKVYDVYNDGLLKGESGVKVDQWQGIVNPSMIKIELSGEVEPHNFKQFLYPDLVGYLDNLNSYLINIPDLKIAFYKFKEVPLQDPIVPEPQITGETENESELSLVNEQTPISNPAEPVKISLPINSSEVHAVIYKRNSKNTYRVIFDSTGDIAKSIDNFKLLLSQTSPDRYDKLSYIDLRLEERAYICLQGASCNK